MDIIIGADFVPTESNISLFQAGDIETLLGEELVNLINNANHRIFNLEMPLCDSLSPINKCGSNLSAPTKAINAYKKLNVTALTLANNHIADQGSQGLQSTISLLRHNGIDYFGAGSSLEACKPYILNVKGKRIAIYACVEHEFSVATERKPGACPFDPLYSLDEIAELKKNCDHVVVLYHGGKEHYRYPSPLLQKNCRRMIDKGADLILCQHSHCIGCEEKYAGGVILYGQGNFLFDDSNEECWQTGLLVGIDVDNFANCTYYPVKKHKNTVRLASEDEKRIILNDFYRRSEEIKSPAFVTEKYGELSEGLLEHYLIALSGKKSIFYRALNKFSGYKYRGFTVRRKYDRKAMTVIRNFVECEAHREVLLNAIIRATEEEHYEN